MQTATDRFKEFFLPICEAAPGVIYTAMSDADRLDRFWAESRSEGVYPGVFVLRPKYKGWGEDLLIAYFDVIFYVFCEGDLNDYDSQDAAYKQAEEIVTHIAKELQHAGYEKRCFYTFADFKAEPVLYETVDSVWGYEVKVNFGLLVNDIVC
jgi:hypothetical protein